MTRSPAEAGWRQGSVGRLLCSWKAAPRRKRHRPRAAAVFPPLSAPRTALPSVPDPGLLPEQLGMQISTCEAKSRVSPHQAATPQPHLAVPPPAHSPESRWPRLAILAGCDINQKLRLFCNFWNGFESLLRSCFIFFTFFTCAEVGECSGQRAEAPASSHPPQPRTHLSFVELLVPLINDSPALGQRCVPNGVLAHGRNPTLPGQHCRAAKSAKDRAVPCCPSPRLEPLAAHPVPHAQLHLPACRSSPCLHWLGGSAPTQGSGGGCTAACPPR